MAARLLFHSPLSFVLFDTGTHLNCPMKESEQFVRPYGELGKYLHEYRHTSPAFMSPRKGFFDMGDIVALVDPEIASWEETECPELGWDRNGLLDYRFKGTLGSILRCYDMDRDKAFALLYSKLKNHYGG